MSQYRQEAQNHARMSNTLKVTLSEFEFTMECQSKELAALCTEQQGLKETLAQACREKDELLQRWMEEKREEADRLNKYNDAQERWQLKNLRNASHKGLSWEPRTFFRIIPFTYLMKSFHRTTSVHFDFLPGLFLHISKTGGVWCIGGTFSVDSARLLKGFKMAKGKKRYPKDHCGKWFAHPTVKEGEPRKCEGSTSTGLMLSQVISSLPQALEFERYPKWKKEQTSRVYPFSVHDNKYMLKDDISVYIEGGGRRKCLEGRQFVSQICLCHDGPDGSATTAEPSGSRTTYQTHFTTKEAADIPANRRFTHNHKEKSEQAALAQAGETFMWFGRHDSDKFETLELIEATSSFTRSAKS
ncbi:hypothetical protein JOB18_022962 [Solea senegalensis]|nr:hypothetical protein JOB18_022962 [Solea senegalensis]